MMNASGASEERCILLVEDSSVVREHVARLLRRFGFEVRACASGREALDWLAGGAACELLFTDLAMPGELDGGGLVQGARALRPGLPVIVSSGLLQAGGHLPSALSGCVSLPKPYSLADLSAAIETAMAATPSNPG